MRALADARALPHEHPVLAPSRRVFDDLGIAADPVALVVMASGVRYVAAIEREDETFGGFDAAFDLFEAAGFNCEQFRSVDPHAFLNAVRREHDLAERRWRAVPIWSLRPEGSADGESGPGAQILPIALSEFDADSVRVTSAVGDRRVGFDELLGTRMHVWGYAAPVPSLRAIISPSRYDFAARAARSLRLLLQRMRVAADGLSSLEAFLASEPSVAAIGRYRRGLGRASGGDPTFARSILVDAIERYGDQFVSQAAHDGFTRSAQLHAAFLGGDDGALAEIAAVERRALDRSRRSTSAEGAS